MPARLHPNLADFTNGIFQGVAPIIAIKAFTDGSTKGGLAQDFGAIGRYSDNKPGPDY